MLEARAPDGQPPLSPPLPGGGEGRSVLRRGRAGGRGRYGLGSVPGGRHPGWGTANRIVPLGPDYLELMAVVDPGEASRDAVGRALSRLLAGGDGLLMWCLATDDLDSTASRLGLAI